MQRFIALLFSLSLLSLSTLSVAAQPADPTLAAGMVNPGYHEKPAWFKNSFLDIRDDIAEAKAANKRLLLYFYQDGCPYCAKLLTEGFGQAAIATQTQQQFDVLAINLWGDKEVTDLAGKVTTEKAFAKELAVQFTPTLLFMDEAGKVVLRANGYYAPEKLTQALNYVAGKHETAGNFSAFLAKQTHATSAELAPIAASLPTPLTLQDARKVSKRPLLVLFEQTECENCAALRKILARKEVALALTNVDLAQVNPADQRLLQTPDGKELKASEWASALGIQYSPSLVFFDDAGQEVFRTEAHLNGFHIHSAIDYVVSGAYRWQPEFQRYLQHRTAILQARGVSTDLLE